ncbi:WEB family protein At3g02930, chloroplastic isoform X2 [Homalodisca vitripennis]|nr:WEB family protein At3g02930, chloroplastic isoform X2 [Homalodisca vitripennis]XP_046680144.1 WEB family protein At3g02930, chloroplastic isoform X2 [Homalodisca vitripennis]
MSATPSFGYRTGNRSKKQPPWSRPQSAGSSILRRNKLAAKFSDPALHDPDYCPNFGATYTLSSSQLLQSLMGSCSINEGLDSDTTPTPSPQPSLGDTIRAAAQLEPGLTAKPPIPPTPTPPPQPRAGTDSNSLDDIIALKFQRWFPDAILESEVIRRTSLTVTPFEGQRDETDQSDAGTSITDGADLSDNEKSLSRGNVSTFVKKSRFAKQGDEDVKKSVVKFNDSATKTNSSVQGKKSPKIVVQEPDPYGCDVVTEEFSSDTNIRCLTPDYLATLKKSSHFLKGQVDKRLSLSDLTDAHPSSSNLRSHSVNLYSDSELYKEDERKERSDRSRKGYSDSELYKSEEPGRIKSLKHNDQVLSINEIASPVSLETTASKYRFTSTPVGNESNRELPIAVDDLHEKSRSPSKNSNNGICKEESNNFSDYNNKVPSYNRQGETSSLSPPIRLRGEEDALYHDHISSKKSVDMPDKQSKTFINIDKEDVSVLGREKQFEAVNKQHNQMLGTGETKLNSYSTNPRRSLDNSKFLSEWSPSSSPVERNLSTIQEKTNDYQPKANTKYGSLENMNSDFGQRGSRPNKEICRAASVPPYPSTKSPGPVSKQSPSKVGRQLLQNSKKKVRRSMSYDASATPEITEKDSGVSSYEDIVTMIKVLEKEDLETPVIKYKASPPIDSLVPDQSSSAKAILNYLDEVEKGTITSAVEVERSCSISGDDGIKARSSRDSGAVGTPVSSRLGTLLNTDTAELAQQVMTVSLQLEESQALCKALEERYNKSVELLKQQKTESDETDKRHQRFIDQLLKEKRQLAVQYETAIREMEAKHETAVKVIEERHKVEMKKAQEKFNAAEKIRRDKWIDTKTKKIKELTVRGLEPELERMATAHQEELAELRRVHQRQLTEAEAAWARRTAALREQEACERQAAVQHEREAARHRLEQELCQVEKSYQEQRRRLLEEVRQEKELLQRQNERILAEKQTELAKQVDEAKQKLQLKLADYEKKHQEELAKMKECLETEKQAWITRQKGGLEEREAALREELKRERDRHIELVIRRLESEAATKEQAIENKIKRLKESYDSEVSDLDSTLKELRARLKDTRAELQKSEDNNAALAAQLSQAQNELLPLRQKIDKLRREHTEAMQQSEAKMALLQRELNETKQSFQEQVNKIHTEKENQLQQVYTRVKEAISKKEDALLVVTKQRDTALEQCSRLEKLLETQRNHSLKL